MFRIEVLCEDKKLSKLMWSLVGLVIGEPKVKPLRHADEDPSEQPNESSELATLLGTELKKSRPGNKKPVGESVPDKVVVHLAKSNISSITWKTIKAAIEAVGASPGGISAIRDKLRAQGLISGPDNNGNYQLNLPAIEGRFGALKQPGATRGTKLQSAFQQRTLNTKPKKVFADTLPGRVAKLFVDNGVVSVFNEGIAGAVQEAGGAPGSSYYATLILQKLKILGLKGPDGTYTLNTAEYRKLVEAGEH